MGGGVISLCRGHGEGKVYTDGEVTWVAVLLQEESLAMLRRMYGSKGRNVTRSQCSLAQLYTVDGRLQLDDPMSLHEELLAMKRHIHGSKGHSDVGVSDTAARTFRGLFRGLYDHYK